MPVWRNERAALAVTFTGAARVPVPPLVAAKKPLAELVLSASVVVPVLVALLPNVSTSWRPSVMLVVAEATAVVGAGVMATLVAAPALIVTVVVPQVAAPFLAVMVGTAAVSSP